MIIYKQLGDGAQTSFAQAWGTGYALDNATEWQEVFKTAVQAVLVLVILDMLRVTKNGTWFEQHGAARAVLRVVMHAMPDACSRAAQSTLCRCRRSCSTAPRAPGGSRRGCWCSCRRG